MGWFSDTPKETPVIGSAALDRELMIKDLSAHGFGFPDSFNVWDALHYTLRHLAALRDRVTELEEKMK